MRKPVLILLLLLLLGVIAAIVFFLTRPTGDTGVADVLACDPSAVLNFESFSSGANATVISNQFTTSHGVTFRTGTKVDAAGTVYPGTCATAPFLANRGLPHEAFDGASVTDTQTRDQVIASHRATVGTWFITTNNQPFNATEPNRVHCPLIIDYTTPTLQASFDLIDVDTAETHVVRGYDANNNIVYTANVVGAASGDARVRRVVIPTQTTPMVRIEVVSSAPKPEGSSWGLAFDNFSPACATLDPVQCGNGVLEVGEECDDGNTDDGDACSSTCELPTQCNDGEDNDGDGRVDCEPGNEDPGCFPDGNGGGGECDEDDDDETDVAPVCGNGTIEAGEQCDDGNTVNGDGCSNTCQTTTECNDGEDNDGDGRVDCQPGNEDPGCFPNGVGGGGACNPLDDDEVDAPSTCGNGVIETGEQCDDGNTVNGDGCSNVCAITTQCNDGVDNDGDGRIDCQAGNQDLGCYPNGNGGGGACNPSDNSEQNAAAAAALPDTGIFDEPGYLLVGIMLLLGGVLVYRSGLLQQVHFMDNAFGGLSSVFGPESFEDRVNSDIRAKQRNKD